MKKEKAPRNRTLTLNAEEESIYRQHLITSDDLRSLDTSYINRTINDDLMLTLPLLPDEFADLIIIDPPYNLTKDFNGNKFAARTQEEYITYLRQWLPLVVKKLKPTGSLYLCGDWRCSAAMQQVLSEHLHIMNRITWQREKGRGALSNWKNSMEDIWFAVKAPNNYYFNLDAVKIKRQVIAPYKQNGKPKDWEETEKGNFRMTCPSNFWDDISVPFWSMPENTDHPTQKPEKLIAKLVLASSREGDMVFDPFLGSGTTSVVAKKLHRHYCGVEINPEYCCWAEKRLELATEDNTIQGYTDGVFWERNTLLQQNVQTNPTKKTHTIKTQSKQLALF
ncbi:MAG: site-specific DNA-methyltransferase [Bacteroidaceae bacterium]|nr:site-specific DNA-methyltransferase [Bacteroidaceae bacterium]